MGKSKTVNDLTLCWAARGQLFTVSLSDSLRHRNEMVNKFNTHSGRSSKQSSKSTAPSSLKQGRKKQSKFANRQAVTDSQMLASIKPSFDMSYVDVPEPSYRPETNPDPSDMFEQNKVFEMVFCVRHDAVTELELAGAVGERVKVLYIMPSWWWCRNARKNEGYVPMMKLSTPEGVPAVLLQGGSRQSTSLISEFDAQEELRASPIDRSDYSQVKKRNSEVLTQMLSDAFANVTITSPSQSPKLPPRKYDREWAQSITSEKELDQFKPESEKANPDPTTTETATTHEPELPIEDDIEEFGFPQHHTQDDEKKGMRTLIRERQAALKRVERRMSNWNEVQNVDPELQPVLDKRRRQSDNIQLAAEMFKKSSLKPDPVSLAAQKFKQSLKHE